MIIDAAYIKRIYNLTSTAALTYIYLRNVSASSAKRGKAYTYCGRQRIADELGISLRTAQRAVKKLSEVGLITIQRIGCHCNDHIFVRDIASDVISCSDTLSYQNILMSETTNNTSIYPVKKQDDDDKIALPREVASSEIVAHVERKRDEIRADRTKNKPTPKSVRTSKHDKKMRVQELKQRLGVKFKTATAERYTAYEWREDHEQACQAVAIVADACAVSNKIAVRGRYIASDQYLDMINKLGVLDLREVLQRVQIANLTVGIRNMRGYLLSALYCQAETVALGVS